jgi:hypothetical protein
MAGLGEKKFKNIYDFKNWIQFPKVGMILKIGFDFENWV